ncbi:MAG: cysteine desulfurase [Rikenellaceae bacterium]
MLDIKKIKSDFPILSQRVNGRDLVYLDSGATSQKPQSVIDTTNYLLSECNANIHRGAHYMSNKVTEQYEKARETITNFIGAKSIKSVVFTSGTTASINLVASSYGTFIEKGDHILVSEMEHHSNIVPWQLLCERTGAELKVIPFDENGELIIEKYLDILTPKCKIVAVTAISNVLGTINDLDFIIKTAHERGAKVLVDGCQGIVHSKVDVTALDCDFFAFSGHKLYGPTGIGILYAKEELLEMMPPYMGGGDMVATVTFEKTTYAELPLKFEAGTTNYIGAIGLATAIEYIESLGVDNILKSEKALCSYAIEQISKIEGIRIFGNAENRSAIVSFNIEGIHPFDLALLLDKQGIAVRSGTHCAQPVMQHFGMTGCVRASFALYNSFDDVDKLCAAIEVAVGMLR